jgi:hypothetical protein
MLAGCMVDGGGGGSKPPPGKDWFGNPAPTGPVCAPVGKKPVFPYDPRSQQKPSVVPDGWRWMVVTLRVNAVVIRGDGTIDVNACNVATVHVDASQAGNPLPIKMNTQTGEITNLPYDGTIRTPWTNTWFVFAYDPRTWDHDIPPQYNIILAVRWDVALDPPGTPRPVQLRCAIGVFGQDVEYEVHQNPASRGGRSVQCRHSNNAYWI